MQSPPRMSIVKYLEKVHPREMVGKLKQRLTIIMGMAKLEELPVSTDDPENEHKAYELLGWAIMRVELITEFNKELMQWATNYTAYIPWAKELWELREHMNKQANLARELIRTIILRKYKKKIEKNGPV